VLAAFFVISLIIFAVLLAWTSILIPPETNDSKRREIHASGVLCSRRRLASRACRYSGGSTQLWPSTMRRPIEKGVLRIRPLCGRRPFSVWTIIIVVFQLTGKTAGRV